MHLTFEGGLDVVETCTTIVFLNCHNFAMTKNIEKERLCMRGFWQCAQKKNQCKTFESFV